MEPLAFLDQFLLSDSKEGLQRHIVIIGHSVYHELLMMADNGIDLSDREKYKGVVGVIDTLQLVRELQLPGPNYLKGALDTMGVPWKSLHKAGADANCEIAFHAVFAQSGRGRLG